MLPKLTDANIDCAWQTGRCFPTMMLQHLHLSHLPVSVQTANCATCNKPPP